MAGVRVSVTVRVRARGMFRVRIRPWLGLGSRVGFGSG